MPRLKVIDRDGVAHEVEGKPGLKVMEILRDHDLGVLAICGGMCSCATCHVYVDPEWVERVPAQQPDERELVAELSCRRANSRLSCQIQFAEALDGLKVTVAPDE
jgi:ferredoxin, 2Fe-2S